MIDNFIIINLTFPAASQVKIIELDLISKNFPQYVFNKTGSVIRITNQHGKCSQLSIEMNQANSNIFI
jgi:hypothetical protein